MCIVLQWKHGRAHLNTNCPKSLILEGGIHMNQLKLVQTAARAGCGLPLHHSSPSSHKHAQLHAPAQPGPRGAMPAVSGGSRSRDSGPSAQQELGAPWGCSSKPQECREPLQALPSTQEYQAKPSHSCSHLSPRRLRDPQEWMSGTCITR